MNTFNDDGELITKELLPNGSLVSVTKENLMTFIYLYADFKLNKETNRQNKAFLSGFREMIPLYWIRMFNQHELQILIGGDDYRGIDIPDLKRHCTYSGGKKQFLK